MLRDKLEVLVSDTAVSDVKFFVQMVECIDQEEEMQRTTGLDLTRADSVEYRMFEADMDWFRTAVKKHRPTVWRMHGMHVKRMHRYCCGSQHNAD